MSLMAYIVVVTFDAPLRRWYVSSSVSLVLVLILQG